MLKNWKLISLLLLITNSAFCQFQAANWPVNRYCIRITNNFYIDSFPTGGGALGFSANSSISNSQGELLFFSMGIDARTRYGTIMENGCCLCESIEMPQNCNAGLAGNPHMQGALILPRPGFQSQYILFIKDMDIAPRGQPTRVTASVIDMTYNNGMGKVISRAIPIINDTLSDSRMTACRHANGRDWWLINHEYNTNRIYTHLITPDSIYGPYSQNIGGAGLEPDNSGWSVFSPSGDLFATTTAGFGGFCLYNFDRCNGMFFSDITITVDSLSYCDMLAFSPNSKYLYVSNIRSVYQYDVSGSNISQSAKLVANDTASNPRLGMMLLMPDSNIYMAAWGGSEECLSIIDRPNEVSPLCSFHLREFCPTVIQQIYNVPNFANYNLGTLVGSGCDTIETGTISEQLNNTTKLNIRPNPADDHAVIELPLTGNFAMHLRNSVGQIVVAMNVQGRADVYTGELPNGIYFLSITKGTLMHTGKLVIQH